LTACRKQAGARQTLPALPVKARFDTPTSIHPNKTVIMKANSLQNYLESLLRDHAGLDDGAMASYIPELLKADPAWFGIALVMVDGHVYQAGDSRQPFTIQSISKAITYGLALEDQGFAAVLAKVDVEPSGEAFNSISLEPDTGRPKNPMINAGAIATVSLIEGDSPAAKFHRLLACYEKYLGHPVAVDEAVYRSEKATGHRNRAIAHLLRSSNIIEHDTDGVLDVYFKQCALLVTCEDLALIGATLANNGVNPRTGNRALQDRYVPATLSVMSSCGMYDYSGAKIYQVGMPAKSGVGGGILAVLPGQFGLAVFSPPLDGRGNSVRGIAVCKKLSADFGLHMFHTGRATAASVIHARYDAAHVPSKRTREPAQNQALAELGHSVIVLELQGDLTFTAAEIVMHESLCAVEQADFLILDFTRVDEVDDSAATLIADLVKSLHELPKPVLLTGHAQKLALATKIRQWIAAADALPLLNCVDIDHAVEWCEQKLLASQFPLEEGEVALSAQSLCAGFSAEELDLLESLLERRSYPQGSYLCREGEPAQALFFILSGQITLTAPLALKRSGRLTTLAAGSAFAETALLEAGTHSADMQADVPVSCAVLDYSRLEAERSSVAVQLRYKLVSNVARSLAHKLRQARLEIQSLRG
jgi:glutaminase